MHYFSQASQRNKGPILGQLIKWLKGDETILEIGSGSGQHGVFFSEHLENIKWQFTDQKEYLEKLTENIKDIDNPNLYEPFELDVMTYQWGSRKYDAIFSANTLHIMSEIQVDFFLEHVHLALNPKAKLIIYGPFNYNGKFTSPSNQVFDEYLKENNLGGGIKSFERLDRILKQHAFNLISDVKMPANNQLILWQKR